MTSWRGIPLGLVCVGLAACGCATPKADTEKAPVKMAFTPETLGCPADLDVRVVYRQEAPDGSTMFILHDRIMEDSEDLWFAGMPDDELGFRIMTPGEADAARVNTSREPIWMFGEEGRPSCQARPVRPVIIRDGEGFRYTHTGMEVEFQGCDIGEKSYALGFQNRIQPDCRMSRISSMSDHDPGALVKMGMPDEFASALRSEGCSEPCEMHYEAAGSRSNRGAFYETTITYVHPKPGEEACMWEREDWYGVFFRKIGDHPMVLLDGAVGLTATFVDKGGVRGALMVNDGVIAVYPIGDGNAVPQATVRYEWFIPHDEERTQRSLAEDCL